jgi:hypothetical protein
MRHSLVPIPCRPWMLNGLSERLLVSHYENDYGAAVRSLNAIQEALAALDLDAAPGYQLRAMKHEELAARGSVVLHELYFRRPRRRRRRALHRLRPRRDGRGARVGGADAAVRRAGRVAP